MLSTTHSSNNIPETRHTDSMLARCWATVAMVQHWTNDGSVYSAANGRYESNGNLILAHRLRLQTSVIIVNVLWLLWVQNYSHRKKMEEEEFQVILGVADWSILKPLRSTQKISLSANLRLCLRFKYALNRSPLYIIFDRCASVPGNKTGTSFWIFWLKYFFQ